MTPEHFRSLQRTLPSEPGIYKYYDAEGRLIYVGKAKDIRKRVASYFSGRTATRKTSELVRRIERIEYTITDTEQDAFLLENQLIKENQPKYNIDLKDDKTYPFIVIRNEPFPRVFLTRRVVRDGSEYLGPFTSTGKVRELLRFIRQHVQIRTCKLNLSQRNIAKGAYKVCLEYQLGNCKGPCAGLQSEADYQEGLQRLRGILKGNLSPVLQLYKEQMKAYVEELEFEKAQQLKKKIEHLKTYHARSPIVSQRLGDVDVFGLADDGGESVFVNFLMVRNGCIVDTHTMPFKRKLEEKPSDILQLAVIHLRETFRSRAAEILTSLPIEYPDHEVRCVVPNGGDRRRLIGMSLKNAVFRMEEQRSGRPSQDGSEEDSKTNLLNQLQEDLQLQDLPVHIECFDNSHFQGSYPVSAMVCFRDGKPSKGDYRHFNVKTVSGIDDFATMREVVARRYSRLLAEGEPLPQLVVVDGGKGQLGAALDAVESLGLIGRMTIVGLAKNEEEIFFPGDRDPLRLPMDSPSLRLIRSIRDEVHRFGIGFHRRRRSAGTFSNELERVTGIGKKTADSLLRHFRSVKKIATADREALSAVVGPAKAEKVYSHFHPEG
jgi:excinuclease ABC subunit C